MSFHGTAPASSGSLGLNNAGDVIRLTDGTGVERDSVTYPSSESGVSLNPSPDGAPNAVFAPHDEVGGSAMSPGTRADGSAW